MPEHGLTGSAATYRPQSAGIRHRHLGCWSVILMLGFATPLHAAGTLSVVGRDVWVKVARVYDGDTFRSTDGEKIRLLGINAPEIAHGTEPGQPLGQRAKAALIRLVAGRVVRLKQDVVRRDTYGRLLAQVYLRDGRWVNGLLVGAGYAFVYTFPPNLRWAPALLLLEKTAREKRLGIWSSRRFRVLPATHIGRQHIGQFRLVAGTVSHPAADGFGFRLDGLRISVPRKYQTYFDPPPGLRAGQHVIVRGTIRTAASRLYLALHSPYDLEVSP